MAEHQHDCAKLLFVFILTQTVQYKV